MLVALGLHTFRGFGILGYEADTVDSKFVILLLGMFVTLCALPTVGILSVTKWSTSIGDRADTMYHVLSCFSCCCGSVFFGILFGLATTTNWDFTVVLFFVFFGLLLINTYIICVWARRYSKENPTEIDESQGLELYCPKCICMRKSYTRIV